MDSVSEILNFWTKSEKQSNFDSKKKEIILFLGNTGSGKSTIISLLADVQLESVETHKGSGRFKIIDKIGRISQDSTILSQTLIPELIENQMFDGSYFDCPGFEDTRGVKFDITITYLIWKLLDMAKCVKIVFVIDYNSVIEGGDRRGIIDLARHANKLIKNIDKFSNGIALLVTKVENIPIFLEGKHRIVDDDKTLQGIERFLTRAKYDLNLLNNNKMASIYDRNVNDGTIEFIDILLKKKSNGKLPIEIIRKPLKDGTLADMKLYRKKRIDIIEMIHQHLQFIVKECDDFGFALSDESRNRVYELIDEIQIQMVTDILNIANEILHFLHSKRETNGKDLIQLHRDARSSYRTLNGQFAIFLIEFLCAMQITEITIVPNKIQMYAQHLDFLMKVSGNSILNWDRIFKAVDNATQKLNQYLDHLMDKIEKMLLGQVMAIGCELEHFVSDLETGNSDVTEVYSIMVAFYRNLSKTVDKCGLIFLENFINAIKVHQNTSIEILNNIRDTMHYLKMLERLLPTKITDELHKIIHRTENSQKWLDFLIYLYDELSTTNLKTKHLPYEQLKHDAKIIMEKCSSDDVVHMSNANEIGLAQFLTNVNIKISFDMQTMQLNGFHLNALKTVIATIIINDQITCSSDGRTISGTIVRMSDVIDLPTWQTFSTVEIFAFDTIIFDIDIHRTSGGNPKLLSIIAPKWQIKNAKCINLNGQNAANFDSSAADGHQEYHDGENGHAGLPGTSAGSMFGVGYEFIDGSMLSIQANGGNGGSGQNGGRGYKLVSRRKGAYSFGRHVGGLFSTSGRKLIIDTIIGGGGDGGAFGLAGYAGHVIIIGLNGESKISISCKNGTDGQPGKGGFSENFAKHGTNGANKNGIEHPMPATIINDEIKCKTIEHFKSLANHNMVTIVKKAALRKFIEQM